MRAAACINRYLSGYNFSVKYHKCGTIHLGDTTADRVHDSDQAAHWRIAVVGRWMPAPRNWSVLRQRWFKRSKLRYMGSGETTYDYEFIAGVS